MNSTYVDRTFPLENVSTYNWLLDQDTAKSTFDNRKIRDAIRASVNSELKKKRLVLDTQRPQILMDIILKNTPDYGYVSVGAKDSRAGQSQQFNKDNYRFFNTSTTKNGYSYNRLYPTAGPSAVSFKVQQLATVESTIIIYIIDAKHESLVWTSSSRPRTCCLRKKSSTLESTQSSVRCCSLVPGKEKKR